MTRGHSKTLIGVSLAIVAGLLFYLLVNFPHPTSPGGLTLSGTPQQERAISSAPVPQTMKASLPLTDAAHAPHVRGYVVDDAGNRITDVAVHMSSPADASNLQELVSRVDESGNFEFRHEFASESYFWLAVAGDEFESGQVRFTVADIDPNSPIVLVAFPNTASIGGLLVDRAGRPQAHRPLAATSRDKSIVTVSDGAGAFRFDRLLPGKYDFYVLKDGAVRVGAGAAAPTLSSFTSDSAVRATPEAEVAAGQQLTGLRLEAGGGSRVWGRVTDVRGDPIEGAHLKAWPDGNPSTIATAVTDREGKFELTGIPAESSNVAELHVSHDDFESKQTKAAVETEADVRLIRRAQLRGRVIDASTRAPIVAFRVASWTTDTPVADEIQAPDRLGPATFTSDDAGRFELSTRNGGITIGVLAPGYELGLHRVETDAAVKAGREIVIALQPFTDKPMRGLVVNADGVPQSGASIYFGRITGTPESVTNPQGVFELFSWPTHATTLTAIKEGYGTGETRIPDRASDEEIVIRLRALSSILGDVTIGGQPAAARFESASIFHAESELPTKLVFTGALNDGRRFEIRGVPAGEYDFEVAIDSGSRIIQKRVSVSGQRTAPIPFEFELPPNTALEGYVSSGSGPVSNVRLLARQRIASDAILVLITRTDASGHYRFEGPLPGACEIEVFMDDLGRVGADRYVSKLTVRRSGPTFHDMRIED